MGEKFWIDDPCEIFDIRIFPTADMTKDEKLNALTRLTILVSIALYASKYNQWYIFLIVSLLLIMAVKTRNKTPPMLKEDFTLVPTYTSTDMNVTTVAPLFAEEWQIYPPSYDLYTNTPPQTTFKEPPTPQSYPYGQYLTRSNLLPSDEHATHLLNGGTRQAREYVNNSFLRNELGFRENMTRLYKKKLARRFRHNCNDTFSPYHSY